MRRISAFLATFISFATPVYTCTDFTLPQGDDFVIATRTMEFGVELNSDVIIRPRGQQRHSKDPFGGEGKTWTAKYGYVGVDALGKDIAVDGINEAGLSFGMLWFVGTQYEEVAEKDASEAILAVDLGNWILGSFASVDEVKEAIKGVRVWQEPMDELRCAPPLHFAIHDAQGKSMVIEYLNGRMELHDNDVGVLTNAPAFPWHVANLENFSHLSSVNAPGFGGSHSVHGSGLRGIPGDLTPQGRFVRIATLRNEVNPVEDAEEAVRLAKHIISTVNIPRGSVKSRGDDFVYHENYTQWVLIKDLTNRKFYYHSYESPSLHTVDLAQLDFSGEKEYASIPIAEGHWVQDVTPRHL